MFWATRLLSEMCCKAHLRFFERLPSDRNEWRKNVHLDAAWSPKTIQKPPFICKRMNNRHSSGSAPESNQRDGPCAIDTCDKTNPWTFVMCTGGLGF